MNRDDAVVGIAPLARAWSLTAGYLSIMSALALILFFALADPYGAQLPRWMWLGPANDVLSMALAPVIAIAAVLLWRRLGGVLLGLFTVLLGLGNMVLAVVTGLMLAGAATLETQTIFAVPMIIAMFVWLVLAGLQNRKRSVFAGAETNESGHQLWLVPRLIRFVAGTRFELVKA
ncbi:Hypotetical protein [Gulosibacter molinativorax]|nr:Hypotetical protein [Gulosibacter molinativorax]